MTTHQKVFNTNMDLLTLKPNRFLIHITPTQQLLFIAYFVLSDYQDSCHMKIYVGEVAYGRGYENYTIGTWEGHASSLGGISQHDYLKQLISYKTKCNTGISERASERDLSSELGARTRGNS